MPGSLLNLAKSISSGLGLDTRRTYHALSAASLRAAVREQGLEPMIARLREVLPDLTDQLTLGFDQEEYLRYWELKMRGIHAFQVGCILKALDHLGRDGLTLVDVGDSSGNHSAYVRALAPAGRVKRIVSVNLDPVAIEKVRSKGGEALLCRAEELETESIRPDLVMSFQMVEHLTDPVRFLHGLATRGAAHHALITVPYRRDSRFGGHHLRQSMDRMPRSMTAEEVHLFEFSVADWQLLARFAGFRPVWTDVYWQYPRRSWLRVTAPLWRHFDFEGFLALFLERDLSLAERYADW